MTGIIIVVLLIILVWLIGQTVLLGMLWGQQQRSQSRADLLGRLIGLPSETEGAPVVSLTSPGFARQEVASGPGTSGPGTSAPSRLPDAPAEEAAKPLPELTFPPPLRRTPPVPSAREPLPPPERPAPDAPHPFTPSAPKSAIAGTSAVPEPAPADGERDRGGPGLPAGSVLPDFELTTIDGEPYRRSMLTGRKSVMIFLATDSPGSVAVMESIRSPQVRKRSLPQLVLVIDGGVEANSLKRWLGKLHKRVTIVVQDDTELATVLRVPGTPAAYVLDDQCRTHGALRIGARAVLEALGIGTSQMTATARRSTDLVPHPLVSQRTFSGLPVGSGAPELSMVLIDGGVWERSPEQSCLVIFWDPDCPPCQTMKADLIRHASRWNGFDRIVVSRGVAPDHADIREVGSILPVSIQRGFDVSRQFQVLEAPAAVAIGPDGMISRPPAVGAAAVLSLASELQDRARRASVSEGALDA